MSLRLEGLQSLQPSPHSPRILLLQFDISIKTDSPLFGGLTATQAVLLTHGDSINTIAEGFREIARSGDIVVAIENREKMLYGVQFHPEVDLSVNGVRMLRNFAYDVCKMEGKYTIEDREEKCLTEIRSIVGDKKVRAHQPL